MIAILILIYLVSVIGAYIIVFDSYHKFWYNKSLLLFIISLPIYNTFIVLQTLFNKFFNRW